MDGFMILGIVLLAAGFLFVGIETLIPGFGAPGILGGCCLVAGVFLIADSVQEAVIIVAGYTACKGQVKDTDYSE